MKKEDGLGVVWQNNFNLPKSSRAKTNRVQDYLSIDNNIFLQLLE